MNLDVPALVTVVVPAYKAADFIERTLHSLAAQTWGNLEVIVGDDASPDSTAEVVAAFAARHPNVKTVLRTKNLGWIGNTNDLMKRAQGAYVCFLPHDDWIEPTYVEKLVRALEEHRDAVIAYCDMTFGFDGEEGSVRSFVGLIGVSSPIERAKLMLPMPENWWVPHGIVRTSAFRSIGGLRTAPFIGHISADFTWLFELALIGGFIRVPEVLYHKVWMPESLSYNWDTRFNRKAALLMAVAMATARSSLGPSDKARLLGIIAGEAGYRTAIKVANRVGLARP
jgi:glycosyltransferase involved in cell wall biosynthesis